ncbi:MAG: deoxyguanosinetriphosphate triphosphohydrolase [Clostridiales Family XIII bacterium]|jgi:dGTPase|nr:deoxyguanosinetriphosphate triphosphohydrolase [Clostridiales Family XIII bacterium]
MLTRVDSERREYTILSPFAAKAAESRGRARPETPCSYRTDFQRDRDRIIHSKALRRLWDKTQVFIAPEGDHYRKRLTHTFEVSQISRSIARGLMLNEDLTEAIALGHDLGHTPFGHNGEHFLDERHKEGFKHNEQSLRVVDVLESRGGERGMNLTAEVRDGILGHTGDHMPYTLEGRIVRVSDRIAYINHDIDDAIRAGIISEEDLPSDCVRVLGDSTRGRIDTLVTDMIVSSDERPDISMSEEKWQAMDCLRTYMFEHVYLNPAVKKKEELMEIRHIICSLYDHFLEHPEDITPEYRNMIPDYGTEEMVKDQIAGMTDHYAATTYERIFIPGRRRR